MIIRETIRRTARQYTPPNSVLEGAHARLNEASEKYGGKKGGLFSEIKGWLHTPDPRKCTDTLWGCRGEIERASTKLRVSLKITSHFE